MMTKIEPRWNALEPDPEKPVSQLLDTEHPLRLYIGREVTGEPLFMLVDPVQPPKINSMRSVRISSMERSDGQWSLILRLEQAELSGVFALLCEDLVESSRHLPRGSSGVSLLSRRLANWRRLLETGCNGLLTTEEIRGLIGELLFLEHHLVEQVGPVAAMKAWKGPFGAPQDFQLAGEAWEVKTVHPGSRAVQIASAEQLDSSARSINLVVIPLEEASSGNGCTLNGLVVRLKERLGDVSEAQETFDDRLVELGYMSRSEYDSPIFIAGTPRMFRITDGFPRITAPDLMTGVTEVRYKVQLEACTSFETDSPFSIN